GPSFSQVAGDFGEADKLPLRRADCVDDNVGPELRAILAHAPALSLEAAAALGFLQRQSRDVLQALSVGVKGREMPTNNLIRFIALEAPGAGVPTGHATLAIQHVDRVISDRLNEYPVAAFAGLGGFDAVFHMYPIPAPVGVGHQSTETQLNRFGSTACRRPYD